MKVKNVILGCVATLFAIGGAIASDVVVANYAQTPGVCRQISPVDCGAAGPNACRVTVGSSTYNAYINRGSSATCTNALTTTGTQALQTEFID